MNYWFESIEATTFSLIRSLIVTHDTDSALFQKTLKLAVETDIFKQPLTASSTRHRCTTRKRNQHLLTDAQNDERLTLALRANLDAALTAQVRALAAPSPTSTDKTPPPAKRTYRATAASAHAVAQCTANKELIARAEVTEARRFCPRWCSKT